MNVVEVTRDIHGAIRACREAAGLSQGALGALINVNQQRIASWEADVTPTFEQVAALEDAMGLKLGTILRVAGYVEDLETTADKIRSDPALSIELQDALIAAYESAVRRAR